MAKYPKSLAITPFLLLRNFTVGFSSDRDSNYTVEYAPNIASQWGVAIDYNWLTLGFTTSWGLKDRDYNNKGKTAAFGFSGGLTRAKWIALGGFQYFKGLYITNPNDLQPDYLNASQPIYPHREDIQLFSGRLAWYYIFNHTRYSHPAALYVTTERQLKSAGSLLIGANFRTLNISADSSLIPPSISSHFDSASLVRKNNNYLFLANVGYAHTFVMKQKFFANAGATLGVGPVFSRYVALNESLRKDKVDAGVTLELQLGMGFNSERYYAGVLGNILSIATTAGKDASVDNTMFIVRFFVGYRIPIKHILPILG